jgi:IS30 family transposase
MSKRHHLTDQERDQIAVWVAEKVRVREIARRLKRHHSSIEAEIQRNRWGETYVAIHAQAEAKKRKSAAGKRHPLKDATTYAYVLEKLGWGWSPEQIAGRLELECGKRVICPETIYRFIYASGNKEQKLWEKLPRKQRKRKTYHGRKAQCSRIPQRASIHLRPEEIEDRKEFGHWEGDSVEGKGHKGAIHTQVERKTRFLLAKKLTERTSEQTVAAQIEMFQQLPAAARKTTTNDNGLEFVEHEQLTKKVGIQVYFADPYSSWQRGTNENTNGLLRRYVPKKTDFTPIQQRELNDMVNEINNKPKKCLGYKKPKELFFQELVLAGGFRSRM